MTCADFKFITYRPEYGLEVVKLWRQSFQRAMGLPEQNPADALNNQLDYFCTIDPDTIQIAMDPTSSTIAGFMVLASGELEHLYVHVDYQGLGLGSSFLKEAKAASPGGIQLYTFQKNRRAQLFYVANGFVEVERGIASIDDNPWATSEEQLADIRYLWPG